MSSTLQGRHRLLAEIGRLIDLIESELKRIGYWSPNPPDLRSRYATGEMKTFLDAPSFELWLQQVFIPNARDAVAKDALPKKSEVGLAALRQYDYHSTVPEAHNLLSLLSEFDEMVERCGRSR